MDTDDLVPASPLRLDEAGRVAEDAVAPPCTLPSRVNEGHELGHTFRRALRRLWRRPAEKSRTSQDVAHCGDVSLSRPVGEDPAALDRRPAGLILHRRRSTPSTSAAEVLSDRHAVALRNAGGCSSDDSSSELVVEHHRHGGDPTRRGEGDQETPAIDHAPHYRSACARLGQSAPVDVDHQRAHVTLDVERDSPGKIDPVPRAVLATQHRNDESTMSLGVVLEQVGERMQLRTAFDPIRSPAS